MLAQNLDFAFFCRAFIAIAPRSKISDWILHFSSEKCTCSNFPRWSDCKFFSRPGTNYFTFWQSLAKTLLEEERPTQAFFPFFSQTSIEAEVVAAYNPDWTKHCLVFNPPVVWPVIILFKTLVLFSRGIYVMVGKVWLLLVLGQRGSASRAAPAMVALSHNEPPTLFQRVPSTQLQWLE